MNVVSWLKGIERQGSVDALAPEVSNTRKRKRQQLLTPRSSTMGSNPDIQPILLPRERHRFESTGLEGAEEEDREKQAEGERDNINQTVRGKAKAWSISNRTGSSLLCISRTSPTRGLAMLKGADNPIIVTQINRPDPPMLAELMMMLNTLDRFQSRTDIVPCYLKSSIERRAKWDNNFYNFQHTTPQDEATGNTTALDPELSLDPVLDVFWAENECFDRGHPEVTWNTLVHWPIFQLALGAIIVDASKAHPERDGTQGQGHQVRVRAMPCTAARLKGNEHGKKMVDYRMFVEPPNEELAKITELRKHPRVDYNQPHRLLSAASEAYCPQRRV
ncbi:hypothetical protein F5Y14DRAFT_423530 [Nemania sp. NC0429]|nr:hypothetical protein F5Y14DRAFT_423530 [Nemania sp. NC0429]